MQTLYAFQTTNPSEKPIDPKKILTQHFAQTRSLFVYIIYFVTEIARYAEKDAYKKSKKFAPTEKDLNVNTKLAGSNMLWQILEDANFKTLVKSEKPERYFDEGLIKKIYNKLILSQEYLHYINVPQQSKQEDRKIFEYILDTLMLDNEEFINHIEEYFSNWDDDGELFVQIISGFLNKPSGVDLIQLISKDKEKFAFDLLNAVIDKENYLLEIITPKLKNWDPERIALLDMVLMKMGVSEFLYFDTIPPKVTINEYIDLAKEYSTEQSGQFINGILDNIHKELLQSGQLKKTQFKKS